MRMITNIAGVALINQAMLKRQKTRLIPIPYRA
jgi:hypothetical protein